MNLVLGLLGLLAVRTPLFVVIGFSSMMCFVLWGDGYNTLASLEIIPAKIASLTSKNVLLAIPFFVLSGALMSAGGMARRLVAVAEAMVGHFRGGMAIASVLACMIFAAISGSSPVTLIAVGGIMFPAMMKAGYRENFALGLITTAGSLGCLIPPSIPMLVYAISVSGNSAVNVGDLFLAGLGPAVLIAGMLALYSYFRGGQKEGRPPKPWSERLQVVRDGLWALLMPVIILGGIYSGIFTPTEASAVSVVYAVAVELLIFRELQWVDVGPAILKSVAMMGALLLVIVLSFGLNDFMVEKQVAETILAEIQERNLGPAGFLLAINVFLIVTGALMDSISAIVLFTPLIAPTAVALGIDPLHLGVVFIVNMEIGYVAPPIATNLFVSAQLFQKKFGQVVRSVMPTLGILCIGLVAVTYVPSIALGPVYGPRGQGYYQPFGAGPPKAKPSVQPASDTDGGVTDEAPGHVMSIEEMMKRRREQEAAVDSDGGTP
ncbi:MAG: TRAP transporter large permease [Myxococcaceae bacterium]|nr:TRAP transporter large permease [Myxococcaceae bacterium]